MVHDTKLPAHLGDCVLFSCVYCREIGAEETVAIVRCVLLSIVEKRIVGEPWCEMAV